MSRLRYAEPALSKVEGLDVTEHAPEGFAKAA
jgi:hypothetical protein